MSNVIDWIKKDLKERPFALLAEIISLITAISSSIYLTATMPNTNFLIVYILYFINATAGVFYSVSRGSLSVLLMNTFYVITNSIGLIKIILHMYSI